MITEYTVPGGAVFPEGITGDPDGSTFYVSSSRDGTIFRGRIDAPELEVWQPAGADGRTSALGMAVDGSGRLLVCGSETGYVFGYDTATGALVDRVRVPTDEGTLLNDVCVVGGHAFVTDSQRPVVWRCALGDRLGEPEEWVDLGDADRTPFLNGIVAVHDGATLLVAAQGTEVLWRVDVATRAAERVDLGGLALSADGMVLVDGLLYTCDNVEEPDGAVRFFLSAFRLAADARSGELVGRLERSAADTPTTVAYLADRFYLVNSQLMADRSGQAGPPFTISAVTPGDAAAP
ncbi:SMP-30/gluconolactonase/LRE family protein [Longispora urticae]